jgi:hypothetical protein
MLMLRRTSPVPMLGGRAVDTNVEPCVRHAGGCLGLLGDRMMTVPRLIGQLFSRSGINN